MPTSLYLQEHKRLVEDWQALPFVALELVAEDQACSSGFEPMVSRTWPGTHEHCETMKLSSCQKGIGPRNMTVIDGLIICGKRGGKSFIEQTRVRPY